MRGWDIKQKTKRDLRWGLKMTLGNKGWRAAVLVMLCGTSLAAKAAPLDDELSSLVDGHPLIKSGQAQVSATDKGVAASLAPYLPSVDITGEGSETFEDGVCVADGGVEVEDGVEVDTAGNLAVDTDEL